MEELAAAPGGGFGRFLDGTPSHDHLGDIFASLDAEQFQRCFVAWATANPAGTRHPQPLGD